MTDLDEELRALRRERDELRAAAAHATGEDQAVAELARQNAVLAEKLAAATERLARIDEQVAAAHTQLGLVERSRQQRE